MNAPSCRRAGPEEAETLVGLAADAFDGEGWSPDSLLQSFHQSGVSIFFVTEESAPCGFVILRCVADEGEILSLGMARHARRRGFGRCLLAFVLGEARALGVARLFLEVGAGNEGAKALYRDAGFVEIARRSAYYADGEDALVLRKRLVPLMSDPAAPSGGAEDVDAFEETDHGQT